MPPLATESSLSQEKMLAAARSGGADELGQLLQTIRFHLLSLAEGQLDNCLRGRVSPSDVVQDTLLEAHRDFHQFRGESVGEFLGWVRKMLANNISRMFERHVTTEKRKVGREVPLEVIGANLERSAARLEHILAGDLSSPSAQACHQERLLEVSQALAQLPEDQRRVIMLRHMEDLSFNEIGERLGRSPGACRMLWFRAIDTLRHQFREIT